MAPFKLYLAIAYSPTQQRISQHPSIKTPPSPRWPQTTPTPRCWYLTNLLQYSPNTCCNLFFSSWFRGRPRQPTATTFERLHLHHSRWCQHFSTHQLNRTSQLPCKWSTADWPQAFSLWRLTPRASQKQRRPQAHCHRMHLPPSCC